MEKTIEKFMLDCVRKAISDGAKLESSVIVSAVTDNEVNFTLMNAEDLLKVSMYPLCFFVDSQNAIKYENIKAAVKNIKAKM